MVECNGVSFYKPFEFLERKNLNIKIIYREEIYYL